MAAFGPTKVVVLMVALTSLLLLLQTCSVEAVDILFYSDNGPCSGAVTDGCYDVSENTCCTFTSGGAVQIVNLLNGESANIYTGGGCTTQVTSLNGPNAGECYYNDAFSGAFWYYNT